MLRQRHNHTRVPGWLVAAAAVAGATAAAFAVLRVVRGRRDARHTSDLELLEDAAVVALRNDSITSTCAIEIAALAPGIIELTGVVPTNEAGARAARLLHALPGVRTVINRLDAGNLEDQMRRNRERWARGDGGTREQQWYGMGVGSGHRRQSANTDPDARAHVERGSDDLPVDAHDDADATAAQADRTPIA